jgi:hypothetical protein
LFCTRVHLINLKTGKVLGEQEEQTTGDLYGGFGHPSKRHENWDYYAGVEPVVISILR